PTGVGKSSVLRAGVAHHLRQEPDVELHIIDSWTGDAAAALREAVEASPGADRDIYVILDQFEEYFVYRSDDALADELAQIVGRGGPRVNILIGIREDALALLDRFKRRVPNLLANRLQLQRLDRESARMAIVGPVERYNQLTNESFAVEPALVGALLD